MRSVGDRASSGMHSRNDFAPHLNAARSASKNMLDFLMLFVWLCPFIVDFTDEHTCIGHLTLNFFYDMVCIYCKSNSQGINI